MVQEELEKLINMYTLSPEQFSEYKKNVIMSITTGVQPTEKDNEILMIVGGQAGAGKTKLIDLTKEELQRNAVIVNFDELRAMHPFYPEVRETYPNIVHRILQQDTNKVKDEVLEELIERGYNVIYEGALRDTQGFVKFAKDFKEKGYSVKMNVMAVPKLESFGSTFVRYAMAYVTNETPRWVEQKFHDDSYEGVIKTVRAFEEDGIADDIRVFVRGDSADNTPKKIYSMEEKQYKDSVTAIEIGRETGRRKAIEDYPTKYKMVKSVFEEKCPELIPKLKPWEELYISEQKHFDALSLD